MKLTAIEPEDYTWILWKGFTFCLGLQSDGAVWTSGQSAALYNAEQRKSIVTGTMAEQSRTSYTKLLDVLAAVGLGQDDVAHIVENVTAAGLPDYADAAAVRREIFGDRPIPVTTVAVDRLVRGAALIEIELHGVRGGGSPFGAVKGWTNTAVGESHLGTVYVPTLLPLTDDGEVVSPGDPVAQYRYCLDRGEAALASAGLGVENVVSAQEYVLATERAALADLAAVRMERWGRDAAGGTVLMKRLHRDGVTVAVDVIASRGAKSVVDPGWKRFADLPMVPAVESNGVLYLSALAALDPTTGELLHPGDLEAQADVVYRQLVDLVRAGGGEPASIRSTIEFCVADRIAEYRVVAGVRERHLSPPWPASTGDLCSGFPVEGSLIQTTAIAHRV
jgi:Putative translation initiation inhibitor, yjgF family